MKNQNGYTLVELLIVLFALALFLTIVVGLGALAYFLFF